MMIDKQKAYGTVSWEFLEEILLILGFSRRFMDLLWYV